MRFVPVNELRRRDAEEISRGTPAIELMERAGAGLARSINALLEARRGQACLLVTGRGNNGGDALVAARLLEIWGVRCTLLMTSAPETLKGTARDAWEAYVTAVPNGSYKILADEQSWDTLRPTRLVPPRSVVVDALLGTGTHGKPRGVIRAAISWIQQAAAYAAVVAVDLPSGMQADSGSCEDVAVEADLTVTFDAPKRGFQFPEAWPWLGRVETVSIGLKEPLPEPLDDGFCDFLDVANSELCLPERRRDSHKGDFGHLLVVGGAQGFAGAPALTALAALRTGAGLVSAVLPDCASATIAALVPEAMVHALPSAEGQLDFQAFQQWREQMSSFNTWVVGPGLGTGAGPQALLKALLKADYERMLLDADALNLLACQPSLYTFPDASRVILTPHPGEAARLLKTTSSAIQSDRPAAVRQLADATGAIVVLKGCATLVCAPGGRPQMCLAGNPGMASGGSGDVLSGVIGALWGQGVSAWDAARLGVALHAAAGDLAAWRAGEATLIARDIITNLGSASQILASITFAKSQE